MASQFCLSGFGNFVPDFHNLFGYSFNFYTEQVCVFVLFMYSFLQCIFCYFLLDVACTSVNLKSPVWKSKFDVFYFNLALFVFEF